MFPGPQVREALLRADQVALELNLLDPKVQAQMLQLMHRPDPQAAALPATLRQRLAAQARQVCAEANVEHLQPELHMATLTLLSLRQEGVEPAYGVDGFLSGLAQALGKPVLGLETPQQQMDMLSAGPLGERIEALHQGLSLLENGRGRAQALRLVQAWADSDLATLERYPEWCECATTPSERKALQRMLDARHPGMLQQIERLHAAGQTVFVAVGSLHMIGPQGLPAQLAQRGFTLTQVVPSPVASAQSGVAPAPLLPGQGDNP
jgi:uncharacterized protein YbaP (TraB family)